MKNHILICTIWLICYSASGQKLVTTYYDWNKIHPHEQYYVNAAGQKSGAYKEYNRNGVVISEYNYLNGAENGLCVEYAALQGNQRVIKSKGSFKNGKADGYYVQYCDEDGFKSKVQEGQYKLGKKTGLWRVWWCTEIYDKKYVNQLQSEGYYIDNERNGEWKEYTSDGQVTTSIYDNGNKVRANGKFSDGKKTGYWVYYYDNGHVQSEGSYMNDKGEGEWKYYDKNGALNRKGTLLNGKENGLWSIYDPNDSSKPIYTVRWSGGHPIGEWVWYYDKDWQEVYDKTKFAYYKKTTYDSLGQPAKNCTYYFISGEKSSDESVIVKEGKVFRDGPYKTYYKNGKLEMEGSYHNNKQSGPWKMYYENGGIQSELEYDQSGVLINTWIDYYENGKVKEKTYYDKYGRKQGTQKYDENGKEL